MFHTTISPAQAEQLAESAGFTLRADATAMVAERTGMLAEGPLVWTDVCGDPAAHVSPFRTVYPIAR